jgi:uncharacterized protein YbjT (DUF2867 family)
VPPAGRAAPSPGTYFSDGWRVRTLTRHPDAAPARKLAALGAEVIPDMTDKDELAQAFRGAQGVYSVQNFMPDGTDAEILPGRTVGDAAKASGVRHLVYGSARNGGRPISGWDPGTPSSPSKRTFTRWTYH